METASMDADLGYFGPDSVTWRLHGDPVAIVAGLRALLMQALHPGAMAKLVEASDYRHEPWSRLRRTVDYVGVVTFGTRPEADRAAAHVRGVHRRLGVDDPEQFAWVHACLADSFLVTGRAAGIRLGPPDADRYLTEQVRAAELAGVPADRIVRDTADLDELFAEIRPRLHATADARAAALLALVPPMPVAGRYALPARLGWTTAAALAVGVLPGWARRLYTLPPLPGVGLTSAAALHALRIAALALPERYREGPLLREARARAALVTASVTAAAAQPMT